MVVITFRNRLAPGIDLDEYEQRSAKMYELAAAMPGFRSIRSFTSEDGERYYSEYHLQVCEPVRESHREPRAD